MSGWWAWAMSFPAWGNGEISWDAAIPVLGERGELIGVRRVDCENPDD